MPKSTLTSKGQVTIPKPIRERLGLKTGDLLEFRCNDEGQVVLMPVGESAVDRVSGLLRELAPKRPVTVEEMQQAIRRRARRKHA